MIVTALTKRRKTGMKKSVVKITKTKTKERRSQSILGDTRETK